MFWEAVEDFKREYSVETPSRNRELAIGIYDQFIAVHAPLQVLVFFVDLLATIRLHSISYISKLAVPVNRQCCGSGESWYLMGCDASVVVVC